MEDDKNQDSTPDPIVQETKFEHWGMAITMGVVLGIAICVAESKFNLRTLHRISLMIVFIVQLGAIGLAMLLRLANNKFVQGCFSYMTFVVTLNIGLALALGIGGLLVN